MRARRRQGAGHRVRTRNENYRAVYERLATVGPTSRAELARDLSLSPASVSRIVEALLQVDLLREGERVPHGIGRPQTLLHLHADAARVAGVSIRSRSMRIHVADLGGTVLDRKCLPRASDPQALAFQVREAVLGACGELPLAAVVIGISAVWNASERRVFAAPNLGMLEGVDALSLFRTAFAGEVAGGVQIDNDVNLAALGEMEHGSARGIDDFFYLSLGSGVGGAAIVGGRVQRGAAGFAGEVGYLPVHVDGELRPLESLLGRAALERLVRDSGPPLGGGDVFEYLARHGSDTDPVAGRVSDVLAQALASIVTTLDPARIVLGGGVGRYSTAWTTRIQHRLSDFVPVTPDIVSTRIGKEASLLGAVALGRVAARHALVSRISRS